MQIVLLAAVLALVALVVWQTRHTSAAVARAALADHFQAQAERLEEELRAIRENAVAEADALRAAAAAERAEHFAQLRMVEAAAAQERSELYTRIQGSVPPPALYGSDPLPGQQKLSITEDDEIRADLGQPPDDYAQRVEGALLAVSEAARAEGMVLE